MLGTIIFVIGCVVLACIVVREIRRIIFLAGHRPAARLRPWRGIKPYAIDGDTLAIGGERLRIIGLDAPERGQMTLDGAIDAGRAARQVCANLLSSRALAIERSGSYDVYGRTLATVFVDGVDIALLMIEAGYAMAGRDAPWAFRRAERRARRQRLGLWAHGGFADPASHRASTTPAQPHRRRA